MTEPVDDDSLLVATARGGSCKAPGRALEDRRRYFLAIAERQFDADLRAKGGLGPGSGDVPGGPATSGSSRVVARRAARAWLRQVLNHNVTAFTRRIYDQLRRKVRTVEKPYHPRTSASVDSQSVDTTSGGEHRGRDNAKNVDGRKRHIVVDRMGLLLAVLVTAASVDDAAAADLFARLEGQPMGKVVRMYADSKYHNLKLYEWVEENAAWDLSIVRRPEGSVGRVKLPIRWTGERTFAWLGRAVA